MEIDLTPLPDRGSTYYWGHAGRPSTRGLERLTYTKPRGNALYISVFALASIPLLAYLGSRLSDKIRVDLYQRHRNPESWNWHAGAGKTQFGFRTVKDGTAGIGLIVNVSGTIALGAIGASAGDLTLYELGVVGQSPTPLVLNTKKDLGRFVVAYVNALEAIRAAHPGSVTCMCSLRFLLPLRLRWGGMCCPLPGPQLVIYDCGCFYLGQLFSSNRARIVIPVIFSAQLDGSPAVRYQPVSLVRSLTPARFVRM